MATARVRGPVHLIVAQMTERSASERLSNADHVAGWRRFLTPSMGDVIFITIFSIALVVGAGLTHRDGDLAKHLRLGQAIVENGQLPTVDIYSHTIIGARLVPHEWIAQAALAASERWFGFDGIGVLTAILIAFPWFILYRWLVNRHTPVGLSVALVFLGAASSMIHWAARPHIFTWLFVVTWVILLEDLRLEYRRQVWVLVPLAMLWVNTHGGFILGFYLLGTYLIGALIEKARGKGSGGFETRWRHLVAVLLGTVVVSFVNPSGVRGLLHPFSHLLGDDFLFDFTREFTSPDFHNPLFWPFLAMIVTLVVLRFRWNPTTLILASTATAAGLYAFRNIPIYSLIVIPILADVLTHGRQPSWQINVPTRLREYGLVERRVSGGLLSLILVVAATIALARSPGSGFSFVPGYFPVAALEELGQKPPGDRVFNQFVWGGYLVYCCHPDVPVFIDGQTDFYGPELAREYDQAIRGLPAWRNVFEKHDIDWVLISPETGLAQVLIEAEGWAEMYRDDTSVVFAPSP
jgi:hypothetical protein